VVGADDGMGMGVGTGAEVVVALGAVVVVVVVGAVVVVVVGAVVVVVVVGVAVAVGVLVAAEAGICEGPKEVKARAKATTMAIETAGYATTARTRTWRAMSLFLHFIGNSLAY
jgi:hypothetical protein